MTTKLTITPNPEQASEAAAQSIAAMALATREERGSAHIALCGGNTPKRTYQLLGELIEDWQGIELWMGDERMVALDHPDSNYKMIRETFEGAAPEAIEQLRPVATQLEAKAAAHAYGALLCDRLPTNANGLPVLDIAFQGIGPDGHTASLFPNHQALYETERVCTVVTDSPKPPPLRVTMTLPVLQAAKQVLFLVTGADKATALAGLVAEPSPEVPASLLGGERTEVIADRAAALMVAHS